MGRGGFIACRFTAFGKCIKTASASGIGQRGRRWKIEDGPRKRLRLTRWRQHRTSNAEHRISGGGRGEVLQKETKGTKTGNSLGLLRSLRWFLFTPPAV